MGRFSSSVLGPLMGHLLLSSLVFGFGCGGSSPFYGLTLRVSGDHNGWYRGDQAPVLSWDGERQIYSGVAALPGDELSLRLFAPRVGLSVGAAGAADDALVP